MNLENEIENELKQTIKACTIKATNPKSSIDALQYSQAALNTVNALIMFTRNVTQVLIKPVPKGKK